MIWHGLCGRGNVPQISHSLENTSNQGKASYAKGSLPFSIVVSEVRGLAGYLGFLSQPSKRSLDPLDKIRLKVFGS